MALAGLKQYIKREQISGRELVAIFSGANVNFDRLRHIAELSALGENREALLRSISRNGRAVSSAFAMISARV